MSPHTKQIEPMRALDLYTHNGRTLQGFSCEWANQPKVKYFIGPERVQAIPREPHESDAVWVKFRYCDDPEEERKNTPFYLLPKDPIKAIKKNGGVYYSHCMFNSSPEENENTKS